MENGACYFTDLDGHKLELHVGDLNSRLKDMRDNPGDIFEYYY